MQPDNLISTHSLLGTSMTSEVTVSVPSRDSVYCTKVLISEKVFYPHWRGLTRLMVSPIHFCHSQAI